MAVYGGMRVESVVIGMFASQSHIVVDEATGACAIIDTGDSGRGIETVVARIGARPEMILLTHGHIDHAGGLAAVRRAWPKIPIYLNKLDQDWVDQLERQGQMFGLPVEKAPPIDRFLSDGELIPLGKDVVFKTIFTPGHTEGGVTFLVESRKVAFVGDTLFKGSVGRTDLPGGSFPTLYRSIQERLLTLDDAVVCYSGHGPKTTIGEERRSNPFIRPDLAGRLDEIELG